MLSVTLNIGPAALKALQRLTDAHNEATGETLTVKQWAIRQLKQMAVTEELIAYTTQESERIQQEGSVELDTLTSTREQELLSAIDLMEG